MASGQAPYEKTKKLSCCLSRYGKGEGSFSSVGWFIFFFCSLLTAIPHYSSGSMNVSIINPFVWNIPSILYRILSENYIAYKCGENFWFGTKTNKWKQTTTKQQQRSSNLSYFPTDNSCRSPADQIADCIHLVFIHQYSFRHHQLLSPALAAESEVLASFVAFLMCFMG